MVFKDLQTLFTKQNNILQSPR